ncbi:hypothetical protein DFR65_11310 [Oceanihabitans sediminis]|jgi:hypothetical protein|uniref:Response regulator n=1 Tax=Oceanihabitans sediminis TaxID=1812012 RepID=A0A368P4F4_9FLAO|nr:hypothetical protein [Oceanihabitans sediminis]RBP26940.1 hypothetical protein DFR65_11310 [Oceanihabitans sediminis]RCU56964.1 hypothetical protein DU428_08420 [Oceanihabitans sediminis]
METKYRIGYVDEDIKQVRKYQRRFRKFGFEVVGYEFTQGMTLEDLMQQVYDSNIDLLMIDYKLDESNLVVFNGEAVECAIYDAKPLFPHIIFTNKKDDAEPHVEDWKIIFDKDEIFSEGEDDNKKVQHFIITLERSIEQYRKHIQRRKNDISNLLEKGKIQKLNPDEKHNLLKLQKELKVLDPSNEIEVPEYLLLSENLSEVEDLKDEAEEFLKKLIEKKKKQ